MNSPVKIAPGDGNALQSGISGLPPLMRASLNAESRRDSLRHMYVHVFFSFKTFPIISSHKTCFLTNPVTSHDVVHRKKAKIVLDLFPKLQKNE